MVKWNLVYFYLKLLNVIRGNIINALILYFPELFFFNTCNHNMVSKMVLE